MRSRLAVLSPRRVVSALWAPIALLAGIVAVWKLALARDWITTTILPHPEDIAVAFVQLLGSSWAWDDIGATLWEASAGFTLGAIFGMALAVVSGLSRTLERAVRPYAISLQVTPRIAIAPLIIAWVGFGYSSKIVIAAIITFFPVYINALTGILTVDEDAREMFRSLGAGRLQTFVRLEWPSSLPVTFAGLKTGAGLSLVGAVVGEFIAAQDGLGILIQRFSYQLAIADAFAVLLTLTMLGLLMYGVMEYLDRTTVFWLHDRRMVARTRRRAARAERKQARVRRIPADVRPQQETEPGLARAASAARAERAAVTEADRRANVVTDPRGGDR